MKKRSKKTAENRMEKDRQKGATRHRPAECAGRLGRVWEGYFGNEGSKDKSFKEYSISTGLI